MDLGGLSGEQYLREVYEQSKNSEGERKVLPWLLAGVLAFNTAGAYFMTKNAYAGEKVSYSETSGITPAERFREWIYSKPVMEIGDRIDQKYIKKAEEMFSEIIYSRGGVNSELYKRIFGILLYVVEHIKDTPKGKELKNLVEKEISIIKNDHNIIAYVDYGIFNRFGLKGISVVTNVYADGEKYLLRWIIAGNQKGELGVRTDYERRRGKEHNKDWAGDVITLNESLKH